MVQLMAHIDVHSYGKLLQNRLVGGARRDTKLDTIKTYKFTLALENAVAEDYVTEKFYDPPGRSRSILARRISKSSRRATIAPSTPPTGRARPRSPAISSRLPATMRPARICSSGRQALPRLVFRAARSGRAASFRETMQEAGRAD